MNLSDLFEQRSADTPATIMHHLRMAGVRQKVAARRRRRVLLSGVAMVLAAGLAGAVLLPATDRPVDPAAEPTPSTIQQPGTVALTAGQVRIVDPAGDGSEVRGVAALVDGDPTTVWRTDRYRTADFGRIKPGMGILIDLGEPMPVAAVQLDLVVGGATVELWAGDRDPGDTPDGDAEIVASYLPIGPPQRGGTTMVFEVPSEHQYLLLWITELPPNGAGHFRVQVQQVVVVAAAGS